MLAESITIDLGTLISILGPVVAVGVTIGVMKWRQGHLEKQQEKSDANSERNQEKLEKVDERIFDEIKNLNKTMQRRFNTQDEKAASAEKSMIGKIDSFQSKVFNRFDDVQTQIADHEKRLTVAETEAKHTQEKVDRHAKKITMIGTQFPKRDE